MATITYTAKRRLEKTGYKKVGTDFFSVSSDDSFDAVTTNLSGLLVDQWLQAAGFVKNNNWFQVKSNSTSGKILTNTPPVTHLRLPGVNSNYASTPDSAGNSVVGSIELMAAIAFVDWTPATLSPIIAKDDTSTQRDYRLYLNTDGTLHFNYTTDGSTITGRDAQSTVAVPFSDGAKGWVKATYNSGTGVVQFFTSTDGVTFTQLGTNVTITAGAIHDGTAVLAVGANSTGLTTSSGRIYYAEVRNGIGGPVVAAFDPTRGTRGAASFVASTGETWTINTSGTPPALLQGPLIFDEGAEYLSLPGVTGNNASTPDSAAVSVTGDIDLRVRVAMNDYTPAASQELLCKFINSGQFSFAFFLSSDGKLNLTTSANGTASTNAISSVATGVADGAVKWLRVTRVSSTGVVKFYTSDDYDPATGLGTWTQLGADSSNTSGAIFDGTDQLRVGQDGASPAAGKFYYAEMRNGIAGTVVAAFDPGRAAAGAASLTAYTGEVWTINTSGLPAAALVRTTSVTITGYKRGYGQSYQMEFVLSRADRSNQVKRSLQMPMDDTAPEVILYHEENYDDLQTSVLTESQLAQWREFLSSVSGGELFTYDKYGTIAAPDNPLPAMLSSTSYTEPREAAAYIGGQMIYRIPFQVRVFV